MCFSFLPCCKDPNFLADSDIEEDNFSSPKHIELEERVVGDKKTTVVGRNRIESVAKELSLSTESPKARRSQSGIRALTIPPSVEVLNVIDGLPSTSLKKDIVAPPSSPVSSSEIRQLENLPFHEVENLELIDSIILRSSEVVFPIAEEGEASPKGKEVDDWVQIAR